jgi:hypothetical protein
MVQVPAKPGLGVELDMDQVMKAMSCTRNTAWARAMMRWHAVFDPELDV